MLSEIIVRDLELRDYPAITGLICELGYPSTLEQVSERLSKINKDQNYKTFVAELNGAVVGFVGLCKLFAYEGSGCYVRILALVVNETVRNCGVGTKLILSAENWAGKEGASGIAVDSGIGRKEAHAFYTNRGYKIKDYGFIKSL